MEQSVWLTAVEFPASYDWERDTAYGTVACRLILFSGKERVLSLDAGPDYEISPDPDMHRAVGGHLYTDFATDAETVIRRDGEELFRYPGREAIRGFLLIDGHIHTLGEDRSGGGFAYRIDGEVVLGRDAGLLLEGGAPAAAGQPDLIQDGPLYVEAGQVCFSYCLPGTPPELFLVRDGVAEPVGTAPATVDIFDQRLYKGTLFRVESRSGTSGRPFLVSGDQSVQLAGEPRLGPVPRKCTLVPFGDDMAVRGWYHYPDGFDEFLLWTRHGILYSESRPLRAFSVLPPSSGTPSVAASSGSGSMAYVLSTSDGLVIGKDTETWSPIGRYRLFTPSCARLYPLREQDGGTTRGPNGSITHMQEGGTTRGPNGGITHAQDNGTMRGQDEGEAASTASSSDTRYYVALSGPSCILWVDGVVTPIPLHGYISGMVIE